MTSSVARYVSIDLLENFLKNNLILFHRKVSSDNLVREELDSRKLEREAARDLKEREARHDKEKKDREVRLELERKEQEAREDRRKDREREERKDLMNQAFQLKIINSLQSQPSSVTASEKEKIEINLKYKEEQSDSDSFPVKVFVSSFRELVSCLREFCNVEETLPVHVILFKMSRIVDLYLLESGKTYDVDWKTKDGHCRIHLD